MRFCRKIGVICSLWPLLAACSGRLEPIPSELVGTWTTDAPDYADRYLQISGTGLSFGTGDGRADWKRLRGARVEPQGDGTLYVLQYDSVDGAPGELSITYSPELDAIRLAHRDAVWTRAGAQGD